MNWRIGVLIALEIISGCAAFPENNKLEYRLAEMQQLQKQKNWSFEGRLALVNEKDSISASIFWRHTEALDNIELLGPLAQGRMKVSVRAEEVLVDDGAQVKVYQGQVDEILSELLGLDIPVTALSYWVLGLNDPSLSVLEQPNGFYQGGWLVKYGELQKINAYRLPRKMTAEKDKARVKLIVDEWNCCE